MSAENAGWDWFAAAAAGDDGAIESIARDAARCLASVEGARLLAHLREITIERRLAPAAGEAVLRHIEGQRHLVAYLEAMRARGQGLSVPPHDQRGSR